MGQFDFLYLNESDMLKSGVDNMKNCLNVMQELFELVERGDFRMGGESGYAHGVKMLFPENSEIDGMPKDLPDYRFVAMPAYVGGDYHVCGIKTYGSTPLNKKRGLPRSILMMQLINVDNGLPIAFMSANILSAMRTGAVAGLGAKYIVSNNHCKTVSIVGPGIMSKYFIDALLEVKPEVSKLIIKGRSSKGIEEFADYCKGNYPNLLIEISNTLEDACRNADIIFFGNTNADHFEDNPYIRYEWIKKGSTIISTTAVILEDKIVTMPDVKLACDLFDIYEEWAIGGSYPVQKNVVSLLGMGFLDAVIDGRIDREKIINLCDIVTNNKKIRDDNEDIIIYAVGGMPIEDVAWGHKCYSEAVKKNIGTKLSLWEESHL